MNTEDQIYLIKAMQQGNIEARNELIKQYTGMVGNIAKQYMARGMSYEDLVQEGCLGLLSATEDFDLSYGTKFSTFARYRVKDAIRFALVYKSRMIHIPQYIGQVINKWDETKQTVIKEGKDPTFKNIMTRLQLTKGQKMCLRKGKYAASIQRIKPSHHKEIPENRDDLIDVEIYRAFLESFTGDEKVVAEMRFGLNGEEIKSLQEVGKVLGCTKQWIDKMEKKILQQAAELYA